MVKEAIILAGGLGTRLRSVVNDRPKSMAEVNGKPFMEYLLDFLIDHDIERFIFSVGHKSNFITNYFGSSYRGRQVVYAYEDEPLGTGGAILNAVSLAHHDNVLITNGDSLFRVDVKAEIVAHLEAKNDVTLALKPMKNFERYGSIIMDENNRITDFREKMKIAEGIINGGVYIFNIPAFLDCNFEGKFSIERDYFEAHVKTRKMGGYVADDYFLDIGIPSDFEKAQDEFKAFS